MNKNIAILLPYKEQYTDTKAGAASIWVKDYLLESKLSNQTIVYGNLDKTFRPFTKNFKSLNLKGKFIKKNITYTSLLYDEYLKYKFKIIEVHNRPESLLYLIDKKITSKLIFIFHNNPQDLRGSSTVKERMFIAENTDQIYFVSNWVKKNFSKTYRINIETIVIFYTLL